VFLRSLGQKCRFYSYEPGNPDFWQTSSLENQTTVLDQHKFISSLILFVINFSL
jgi:hypothetical protein